MRRACIDIGSNTTRLLVADCEDPRGLVECHQERAFTRIGASLDESGAIPAAKLVEVSKAVALQVAMAPQLGAVEVICVATAGVHRAINGDELVALVAAECGGLPVRVLTGQAEAHYAFLGAAWGMGESAPGDAIGVVDAGGGSTELVVGAVPDRVDWWVSLPFGSGDLLQADLRSDPPTSAELGAARDHIQGALGDVRPPPVDNVVAVGGSATSLRRLAGDSLDAGAFGRAISLLSHSTAASVASISGLDVERVRLLPAGLLILEAVANLFGAPLQVGNAGLREGILLDR